MTVAAEAAINGATVLWSAPTFGQCEIGWKEMIRACGNGANFLRNRMEVEFPDVGYGKGMIVFRSLDDPDNARGLTAHGVVMDEAPMVHERAWYEVVRPIISDTGGWAFLMGTPKGRNWFWRETVIAKTRDDSLFIQAPTIGVEITPDGLRRKPHLLENPEFPFEEAQLIYSTTNERTFRQEFMAEFISDGGGIFRNIDACATAVGQDFALPGHNYVMGVDWGKWQDFTVLTILDITSGVPEQVWFERFNMIDYHVQMGRFQVAYERFHPSMVVAERNSIGEPIIEHLVRMGIPVWPWTTSNASKAVAVDALTMAFERDQIRILPNDVQLEELRSYEASKLPSGLLKYSAPTGGHDDSVMALALAYQGCGRGYQKVERVPYEIASPNSPKIDPNDIMLGGVQQIAILDKAHDPVAELVKRLAAHPNIEVVIRNR